MAKKILNKVQCAEELERLMAKGMTQEQAEWNIIDRYDEVIFPDEGEDIKEILKKRIKVAHVYDKKKGSVKRERKPDEEKREIIALIENTFKEAYPEASVEVVNIQQKVDIRVNGNYYTIMLTKHKT